MMTALCSEVWFGWPKLVMSCSFFPTTFCADSPLSFKAAEERLHISSVLSDLSVSLQVSFALENCLQLECRKIGTFCLALLLESQGFYILFTIQLIMVATMHYPKLKS